MHVFHRPPTQYLPAVLYVYKFFQWIDCTSRRDKLTCDLVTATANQASHRLDIEVLGPKPLQLLHFQPESALHPQFSEWTSPFYVR